MQGAGFSLHGTMAFLDNEHENRAFRQNNRRKIGSHIFKFVIILLRLLKSVLTHFLDLLFWESKGLLALIKVLSIMMRK